MHQKGLRVFDEILKTRISWITEDKYIVGLFSLSTWLELVLLYDRESNKARTQSNRSRKTRKSTEKLQTFLDGPNASASDIELTCLPPFYTCSGADVITREVCPGSKTSRATSMQPRTVLSIIFASIRESSVSDPSSVYSFLLLRHCYSIIIIIYTYETGLQATSIGTLILKPFGLLNANQLRFCLII